MKYLIVGLGNIGAEYNNTRHNIGFDVVDKLVYDLKGEFKVDKLASVATVKYKSRQLVVIKPSTYMNLSGKAVKYWLDKEKIDVSKLLVISDDIALDIGQLRLKPKGGDAGHNGLTDIIIKLNTTSFPRLRFGVGNDFPRGYQSDYVLGKWSNKEIDILLPRVDTATEIIKSFVSIGMGLTMTNFNNK
ncbi:MAG: aminoacyl-tRNA hydrolase [Marinilabiliales bacterium]|nr:MAG: aminoacyl-tRNA hydrolase [Marinilabiliales bacterium]